jgi:hypothetical protein
MMSFFMPALKICPQSIKLVFNSFPHFITTHINATKNCFNCMCEQDKITWLVSCDHACTVGICHQSIELVFNPLLYAFSATYPHACYPKTASSLYEQVKITWSQVQTVERMEKKKSAKSESSACVQAVFTFRTTLLYFGVELMFFDENSGVPSD